MVFAADGFFFGFDFASAEAGRSNAAANMRGRVSSVVFIREFSEYA